MHEPSLAQQILICYDKILFSDTQRGYQFLFLDYFIIFRFCLVILRLLFFYKNHFIIIIFLYFFLENYFYFFMFRDVPGCSGMFRHVPECSSMFHVPGFIDALIQEGVSASGMPYDFTLFYYGIWKKIGKEESVQELGMWRKNLGYSEML